MNNKLCKKSKKLKITLVSILFVSLALAIFIISLIPFAKINDFASNCYLTPSDILAIEKSNLFGPFVKVQIKNNNSTLPTAKLNISGNIEPEIQFKLFNLIPIKSQKIKVIKDDKVLVGGASIGLVLKTEGVLVVGSSPITTLEGEKDAIEDNILQIGDIITQIENETVEDVSSVAKIVNKEENIDRELTIKGIRKNKEFSTKLKPCYDVKSGKYKLGVWVRDDASGVGTLTFINSKNRFGALGHPICDSDTKMPIGLKEGKIYNCSVLGVNKGSAGNPGEIRGLFMQGKNEQGIIEKNNNYGVFGDIHNDSNFLKDLKEIEVGSRTFVKPGKAQIRCCIDGSKIETFDIEIIKTNYQNYSNDKSMVLRVTDENLISRTGGIVQGMSGSPIIQDGKLIGAVTHVFINDATKGFGVYIDWMLNQ